MSKKILRALLPARKSGGTPLRFRCPRQFVVNGSPKLQSSEHKVLGTEVHFSLRSVIYALPFLSREALRVLGQLGAHEGVEACGFNQRKQATLLSFELTTVHHGRRDVTSLYDTGELQNECANVQIGSSMSCAMIPDSIVNVLAERLAVFFVAGRMRVRKQGSIIAFIISVHHPPSPHLRSNLVSFITLLQHGLSSLP